MQGTTIKTTTYITVSEPMYEYIHTKYLGKMTKKQTSKSSRLKAEMTK